MLLISLTVVGVLIVAAAVFLYGNYQRILVHSSAAAVSAAPTGAVEDPEDAKHFHHNQPYAFLLMGYGGGTHEGGKLTDSMMIVYVQPKVQMVTLISLPRDLWFPLADTIDDTTHYKINAAYAIGSDDRRYPNKPSQFTGPAGGGEMAKEAVSTVLGIPINNFAALDFAGFVKSIDVLGGVDVKVEKTFDDPQYPIEGQEENGCGRTPADLQALTATMSAIQVEAQAEQLFPCRYENLHFDRGTTHMDGATALKFVRSRHSLQDGNDFGRATRQRNLVVAVKDKVLSIGFVPKIISFISSLSYDLQTDLTLADMQTFLQFKDELTSYRITNLALTTNNVLIETRSADHQDILAPKDGIDNWQGIHDWLQASLQQLQASPSATTIPDPKPTPMTKSTAIVRSGATASATVK